FEGVVVAPEEVVPEAALAIKSKGDLLFSDAFLDLLFSCTLIIVFCERIFARHFAGHFWIAVVVRNENCLSSNIVGAVFIKEVGPKFFLEKPRDIFCDGILQK